MLFPCSFAGVVTLSLSWTLLDVPLDLTGLASLEDLHYKLDAQFINICLAHAPAVVTSDCVAEANAVLDAALTERCADLAAAEAKAQAPAAGKVAGLAGESSSVDAAGATASSLLRFRERVAVALGLPTADWGSADLDALEFGAGSGVAARDPYDPLDQCGAVWDALGSGNGGNGGAHWPEVKVVGQYLAIDRDYLLRDLLGCVPRVRFCVEDSGPKMGEAGWTGLVAGDGLRPAAPASARDLLGVKELVAYHAARAPFAAARGVNVSASMGPCEPPAVAPAGGQRPRGHEGGGQHASVVLVRNLNKWGDPQYPNEADAVRAVLLPLLLRWRPAVVVHLSEEVPREDPASLRAAYALARLVVRPFYHAHEPAFVRMVNGVRRPRRRSRPGGDCGGGDDSDEPTAPNVMIVPVGYGQGVHGASPDAPVKASIEVDAVGIGSGGGGSSGGAEAACVPRSGVSAALRWVASSLPTPPHCAPTQGHSSRPLAWAFAGRLGVHPSRVAMSNTFAG